MLDTHPRLDNHSFKKKKKERKMGEGVEERRKGKEERKKERKREGGWERKKERCPRHSELRCQAWR